MTKYLFVLTSSPKDFFCEQTLVAIASLRVHNPGAFVTVLTDDKTAATLTGNRAALKDAVDELKVLELDEKLTPMLRSRYLKTVMRNVVDGDFLYMDSDIAIVGDLSIPEEWKGGIYAVLDFHTNLSKAINRKKVLNNAKMMGFSPILNDEIFNGGVMYAPDTPEARKFFEKWHELWLYCVSKNFPYDMASLAETNYTFGYITKKMPGEWNCQLAYGKEFLPKGKVLHFFGSRIINTCGRKVPASMDVFLPKILRKNFYTDLKEIPVTVNADKSIHINEYYDDVIAHAKEAFLYQTKHAGVFGADIIRSYAFAKVLGFGYKKMPILIKLLELIGKII
ncbi:MAG: hypothetical protein MJZ05_03955 [Fibrobacter sp.]|nr:hypothetical protein [Fibrobacter sp.]